MVTKHEQHGCIIYHEVTPHIMPYTCQGCDFICSIPAITPLGIYVQILRVQARVQIQWSRIETDLWSSALAFTSRPSLPSSPSWGQGPQLQLSSSHDASLPLCEGLGNRSRIAGYATVTLESKCEISYVMKYNGWMQDCLLYTSDAADE